MQFGIDVAQQRIDWDDLVARVQFGGASTTSSRCTAMALGTAST